MNLKTETKIRTVVKAVLWNLLGLLVMTLVGLAATAIGFLCYILYERIWAHIGWGRPGHG
jgi:uncharacterized membrane protein